MTVSKFIPKSTSWKATLIRALERIVNKENGSCPLCKKMEKNEFPGTNCNNCSSGAYRYKYANDYLCFEVVTFLLENRNNAVKLIKIINNIPREKLTPNYIKRVGVDKKLRTKINKLIGCNE